MIPILIAAMLSLWVLPVQAQQTIPLPPRPVATPIRVDSETVPQQSSLDLLNLSQSVEQPKAKDTEPVKAPTKKGKKEKKEKPIKAAILSREDEDKRLNELPAFNLQTNKAPLTDVVTLLADACEMSYVGLEKGVAENVQISVNISKNPYETLKLLAERYNVAMDYQSGIWKFGLYNDNELIARVYRIRYNNLEELTGSGGGGSSTSSSGGSSSSSGSSSGGGGLGSLGGGGGSISAKRDALTKDIETFLGFTSSSPDIVSAADFDVEKMSSIITRGVQRVLPKATEGTDTSAKGKVIYNSENRSMYILATRAQHQWIEKYLAIVDKPQKQILVETKVYETGMSPSQTLGINWSGARLAKDNKVLTGSLETFSEADVTGGLQATLTSGQLRAKLALLDSDSNTTSIQYPRQVTIANRTVTLSSVIQQPVQDTSTESDTSTGSGGTSTQTSVTYIPIGINITILPQIIDENKIKMGIAISVSTIVGEETIDGNKYPIVSERTYNTEAIVQNGYSLAIGGLKGVSNRDAYSGLPFLSKLPIAGGLFKSRTKSHTDTNLLIFISPTILDEYRGGVENDPKFILPRDKDYPERRIFEGTDEESYTDIMLALAGMEREVQLYAQQVKEQVAIESLRLKIDERENELKLMQVRLEEIALQQPQKDVSQASGQIQQYLKDLNELRRSISKNRNLFQR